jgi:hypothetical protein
MKIATYEATVVNGRLILPDDVHLPENTRVLVVVPGETWDRACQIRSPQLAHPEQASDFVMEVQPSPH